MTSILVGLFEMASYLFFVFFRLSHISSSNYLASRRQLSPNSAAFRRALEYCSVWPAIMLPGPLLAAQSISCTFPLNLTGCFPQTSNSGAVQFLTGVHWCSWIAIDWSCQQSSGWLWEENTLREYRQERNRKCFFKWSFHLILCGLKCKCRISKGKFGH